MVMLAFICNGSVYLLGTGREQKIQNENICLQRDSNPHHTSPRQESQRLRPLGHEGLMVISGLMSYRIKEYKLIKPLGHTNLISSSSGIFAQKVGTANEIFF